jgi:hypothetical protein
MNLFYLMIDGFPSTFHGDTFQRQRYKFLGCESNSILTLHTLHFFVRTRMMNWSTFV